MSLTIKHAWRVADVWAEFSLRIAGELVRSTGTAHASQVWLTHRLQRDRLLEEAATRGCRGWLNPPIYFLSSLPQRFGVSGRPIGLLARRHLLARFAAEHAERFRMPSITADAAIARGHMLDALFGELLPEGISGALLESSLQAISGDDFAERRSAWIAAVYSDYLEALEERDAYDPRQIHALVAARIESGGLRDALGGADRLHIFGFQTTRSRRRLLHALARQTEVDVIAYTTGDPLEWGRVSQRIERVEHLPVSAVQPAPDSHSELQWVAVKVKQLLLSGAAEPHEIAVVARSGHEDTRRALTALESAGVPVTARVRTPLAEISALKAVLDLFRAAAESWSYRTLRTVLASPYLGARLDLRPFDRVAGEARPASLAEWQQELERLLVAEEAKDDPDARRMGIHADRLKGVVARFQVIRRTFELLDGAKPLSDWLSLLSRMLAERAFRLQVSRPQYDRYDVVRLDQRGLRQLERLVLEWSALEAGGDRISPRTWYRMLRTLLEGQELVLTTPGQNGVQVLEAHDAAAVPFKATFLIHANDGEFPRSASSGGLFTEEERVALRAAGLPVDDRSAAFARERALWNSVIGSAPQVAISYRTTDPRGTPLLPSLLVPAHDRRATELPRSQEVIDLPLNREHTRRLDAAALAAARGRSDRGIIQVADPAALRHAILVAHAEALRGAPERRVALEALNPWNGLLRDPVVLHRLSERFGPDHPWSPSQLQEYATCPFFFLLDRVLGLREVEEADDEASVLTFGGIAHDVMQAFYNEVMAEPPAVWSAEIAARLTAAAERVFLDRESKREWLGSPLLWQQRKENILGVLHKYVEWELDHLNTCNERPAYCEYTLGGSERAVLITGVDVGGDRVEMCVAGRIDRIDRDARGVHHVLDYKTGRIPPAKGYDDGSTLQAPVYLEALRASGFTVNKGRYRALKSPGKPKNGAEVKVGDHKYRRALAIALSIPDRVRSGRFEVLMAASSDWESWHPDLSICRTCAQLADGSRFDD